MNVGKPKKVVEVTEPTVPYEGDEVKREKKEHEKEPAKS